MPFFIFSFIYRCSLLEQCSNSRYMLRLSIFVVINEKQIIPSRADSARTTQGVLFIWITRKCSMHVMLTFSCYTNLSKLAKSMQFTNQIQAGIRHKNHCFYLSRSAIVPRCCKSTLYHHHTDVETKSMINLANCKS